jgi:hypothetical protein
MPVEGRLEGRTLSLPDERGSDKRWNGSSRLGGSISAVPGRLKSIAVSGRSLDARGTSPMVGKGRYDENDLSSDVRPSMSEVAESGRAKYTGGASGSEKAVGALRSSLT